MGIVTGKLVKILIVTCGTRTGFLPCQAKSPIRLSQISLFW
jgi:hypothetical protein